MSVIEVNIVAYDANPFYIVAKKVRFDWNIACIPHVGQRPKLPCQSDASIYWHNFIIIHGKWKNFRIVLFLQGKVHGPEYRDRQEIENSRTWRHMLIVKLTVTCLKMVVEI